MLRLNIIQDDEPEEIRMDQVPTKKRWKLIPLYKFGFASPTDFIDCQIHYNDSNYLEIISTDNKGVTSNNKIEIFNDTQNLDVENLDVQSIRDRIRRDRALCEARKQYKIKYNEGYQPVGVVTPMVKPMKGYDWGPNSIKSWPVLAQPKIKGFKMLCQDMGLGLLSMRSSSHKPYIQLVHLESSLREYFQYLPKCSILDGELYIPGEEFSVVSSILKAQNSEHITRIQFWISDIVYQDNEGTPFETRHALLNNSFRHYKQDNPSDKSIPLVIVPAKMCYSINDLSESYTEYTKAGYDGLIIKKISNGYPSGSKQYEESLYKQGECNHILVYKPPKRTPEL